MFEVPEVGAGSLRGEVQDPDYMSRIMEVGHWLLEASMEGQDPRRVSGKCPGDCRCPGLGSVASWSALSGAPSPPPPATVRSIVLLLLLQ